MFRAWQANATVNVNTQKNIMNALIAGYDPSNIQLYMIPSGTMDGGAQVDALFSNMGSEL